MPDKRVRFQNIGIRGMSRTEKVADTARNLVPWLLGRDRRVTLSEPLAQILDRPDLMDAENFQDVELLISLGGDGTFLSSARLVARNETPLLGVDLGSLGFLTTVKAPDALQAMEHVLAGEYSLEERMMLSVAIIRDGETAEELSALNEAAIAKGQAKPIVRLITKIDGELLISYPADGLIIATPTGSTAYSLSAGGPIVDPALDALILNPICPHTLMARPLIINGNETISIQLPDHRRDLILTIDGQVTTRLKPGDEIRLAKSPNPARIVRMGKVSYYGSLRTKLGLGGGIGEL